MNKRLGIASFMVILFVTVSIGVFATGSDEPAAAGGTVTFMMWGGAGEKATVEGYLAPFVEQNPDITVEILTPGNYGDALQTMVAGGTPPDIAYFGFPEFVQYHQEGQLTNLQGYADASTVFDASDFNADHLASFSDPRTGDLYSVPKDWSTYVVYYNEDMFENAGLRTPIELYERGEWTLEEFVRAADALTTDDVHGLLFNYGRWKTFIPYFAPDWIQSTTELNVDTPGFISAVNFINDLNVKYGVNPTPDQLRDISPADRFSQQKGAMYIIGRWMTMRYLTSDLPFAWNVVPMPEMDGKAHTWVDMVGYGIPLDAENPDAAWRVIEYLTGTEGQSAVAASGHAIPVRQSVANSEIFLGSVREGFNSEAHIAIEDAAPILVFNNFVKIFYDTMGAKLNLVFTGQITAEEACAELQEMIDDLLKE